MLETVVVVDSLSAWRAPIAGFIAQFLVIGYSLSSGVLLIGLNRDYDFPPALHLPTALVSSGLTFMLSPVVEFLSVRIGTKASMLVAVIFCTSSFLPFLFVPITSVSVVSLLGCSTGIGRAFANFIVLRNTMVAFKKRRGIAASIMKAGASVGAICFPPLFFFLLDVYGARITLFLVGGVFLNLIITLILIPSVVLDEASGRRLTPRPKWRCCRENLSNVRDRAQSIISATEDVKVLKEPLAVKSIFLIFTSCVIWLSFLTAITSMTAYPLYALEVGLSDSMIAASMSTRSVVDVCVRLLIGFLYDRIGTKGKIVTLAISQCIGILGLVPVLFLTSNPVPIMFVYVVCLSICTSSVAVGWMQVITFLSGTFYVGRVMSFLMLMTGISIVVGSFGVGVMRHTVGSYRPLYFFVVFSYSLSAICFLLAANLLDRCSNKPTEMEVDVRDEEMATLSENGETKMKL